jgi:anaerobic magnesium-protoporphyrin IX monomethyl ester cyclase
VHDRQTRGWGKVLGRAAAWWRWEQENYDDPRLLRQLRKLARIVPDDAQAYGHLRPAAGPAPVRDRPYWLSVPRMRRQARSS